MIQKQVKLTDIRQKIILCGLHNTHWSFLECHNNLVTYEISGIGFYLVMEIRKDFKKSISGLEAPMDLLNRVLGEIYFCKLEAWVSEKGNPNQFDLAEVFIYDSVKKDDEVEIFEPWIPGELILHNN